MKTLLLTLALFVSTLLSAQWVCTVDSQYTQPGFYPLPENLPCLEGAGKFNDITIQFVMFDSVEASGYNTRVEYVIIDEIENLPCGINWCTSKVSADTAHRFNNQEMGCIRLWGVTYDAVGQYKININVRVKVSLLSVELPYNTEDLGYRIDLRLNADAMANCPAIDTTSGATLLVGSCPNLLPPCSVNDPCEFWPCDGINEISSLSNLSLSPNPTHGYISVSFTADKPAVYTSRIINIYGQEVSLGKLDVVTGLNVDILDVSQLAAGVYIYTLNDGKSVLTQRFVVE